MENYITKEWLTKHDACSHEIKRFSSFFLDRAEITLENCLLAARLEFDVEWVAYRLLSAPALEVYRKVLDIVWKAMKDATSEAYIAAAATAFYEIWLGDRR